MLLRELYALQDRYGWLPEAELRRLAERLSIPLRRINEVVSSYPIFRIDKPPPRVLVRVCHDPVCQLRGSAELRESLNQIAGDFGEQQVEVESSGCLGQCDSAPAVSINHHVFRGLDPTEIRQLVRSVAAGERLSPQRADNSPLDWKIDPYRGQPGYEALRRFLQAPDPTVVLRELELANLRGNGGLGSSVALKWQAVRDAPGNDKVVIANAHGGEPGSVKDRELLRRAPHVVLEGLLLAGLVTGATRGILFVRHDYLDELESLHAALDWAERSGLCGETTSVFGRPFPIELFISPGHFVSGEQTALLELLEGRRGEPRITPPDPTTHGLHGQPTLVQNVESFAWVPSILLRGGGWFRTQGRRGQTGLRLVSIIGDVLHPGAYEIPAGLTFGELIAVAGGMPSGDELQAIAPAGPLGGFLPTNTPLSPAGGEGPGVRGARLTDLGNPESSESLAPHPNPLPQGGRGSTDQFHTQPTSLLDIPLDPDLIAALGARLGSTFIVLNQKRNLADFTHHCLDFFARESCGKCVPCRLGTRRLVEMFDATRFATPSDESRQLVNDLQHAMQLTSLCELGRVAATPFDSWLRSNSVSTHQLVE